jgi:hypothetical protein
MRPTVGTEPPSSTVGFGDLARRLGGAAVRAARLARRVPARQWPLVLHVVLAWVVVELGLRLVRLPRLAAALGVPLSLTAPAPDPGVRARWDAAELERMALALKVLRRRPFDGTCLRRSLVVGHLMRRRRPRLCLGAKKTAGRVSAHAWLEIDRAFIDVEEPESMVSDDWRRF